ncbi:unnamed protein product [Camellia sinensis]
MMATATVSFAAPRYAPEDPTLPKPWKGLVDGKTGYLYFWNPETNVTQYEKPAASSHTGSAPPQKLSAAPVSSSVQVEQSSHGHCDSIFNDDDDRYNGGSNSGSKLDTGTQSYQASELGWALILLKSLLGKLCTGIQKGLETLFIKEWITITFVSPRWLLMSPRLMMILFCDESQDTPHYESGKGGSDHSQNVPNEEIGVGHGGSSGRGYGFRLLEMAHLSNLIAVSMKLLLGDNVPPPLTSFEATGFPLELLGEVRYLLQGGAKCRSLCYPLMRGLEWDCVL